VTALIVLVAALVVVVVLILVVALALALALIVTLVRLCKSNRPSQERQHNRGTHQSLH
jgi:hypothetical protein